MILKYIFDSYLIHLWNFKRIIFKESAALALCILHSVTENTAVIVCKSVTWVI